MTSKFFLYIAVAPLVVFALTSINLDKIFKKNHVVSARVLYFLLALSMIYLVTNCLYDVFLYTF